jgi:UPF0271 protein
VVDLNADVGEGMDVDADQLGIVTSANVACGFHAGDPLTMVETARRAAAAGVVVGAHPSYYDREGMGRRELDVPADRLQADIVYQLGATAAAAGAAGTRLAYVKPHGSLYNRAALDAGLAAVVVSAITAVGPALGPLAVLCPPGSELAAAAGRRGLAVFTEAFADRAYAPNGTLVRRSEPGAVISDPERAAQRAVTLARDGRVKAVDGSWVGVPASSICIHGDTPDALDVARAVRDALLAAGVEIRAFA